MTEPLAPQYDPKAIETPLYTWWRDQGCFRPRGRPSPYVIMMPPPNVTAQLHMGHGLNLSVQDVLIRFERMRGRDALWVPGTDHAGIATQNVVEKLLAKEGKTRFDLGRDAFVERVREFVAETGTTILEQIRSLGASCDWDRTFYTFSDQLSRAVREVFVALHEKGLIYRGKYIINWCPRCLTALSNEEAEKEETDGRIWRLRYPLADGSGQIVVATTRPETMLGDTAVAVHPEDERYRALIGRMIRLPVVDRLVPIVADAAVDKDFGTGAVKLTPAHDPLDFEIARRHDLPAIDVMTPDARMSDEAPERFRGLDRFEARKRVVAEFEAAGLLDRVEPHRHAVGHCYRCDTVVEPRLSDQWFVKMAPLAQPSLEAYRDGTLTFVPERRGTEYGIWMENIRDWCISRQIWWGHRIPVWYCREPACGRTSVSRTDLTRCPGCGGPVDQDEDVLDTWFSSQLVPFSSLGWPDRTPDLGHFYPGHALVTAPEILFFWVARMIMSGLEFMGQVPFTTIYLHGTVRDTQHRKMSKSLGNGIDPLDVVERYGADALRYTVIGGLAVGTDVILDPNDLESSFSTGRNFANKVWNVGRFILSNLDGPVRPLAGDYPDVVHRNELSVADRWIIARCEATVREATEGYERLRLNDAANAVYRFIWNDLADWYLEAIKPRLYGEQAGGDVARAVAVQTFDVALRLLHPVMPFITETLWKRMPGRHPEATIMLAPWPRPDARAEDPRALAEFGAAQEIVGAIRSIRAEYNVQPGQSIRANLGRGGPAVQAAVRQLKPTIQRLTKVSELTASDAPTDDGASATAVLADGTSVTVPLGDLVDIAKECARLGGEVDRLRQAIGNQEKKLGNEQFVSRAPADVVQREREKLAAWRDQVDVLTAKRATLGCPS
ncbi:MAG: valine--tRNA ligase [Gemmatimonadales bacterium]|nr:valine--tRNA ligase [Gemmatimonadales bacterium]